MERAVVLSVKFSISQSKQIDEAVKQFGFKNTSELIRLSVAYFFDFTKLKEKLKDPEINRKFIEEHDPLIQNEKDVIKLDQVVGHMTEDELNRIQFALAKKYSKRISIINKSVKMNQEIMSRGGEVEPKVGYKHVRLYNDKNDDTMFYTPIKPDYTEWKELSMLQKEILRDELNIKSETYFKRYGQVPHLLDYNLKEIIEAIKREKK